jgi:predicted enzyme related to lactoylglutathione lyase
MFTIALPTADRRTTFRFCEEGLGLQAFGEPAPDGVPEPLQFRLGDSTTLMFVPTDGFGGVVGVPEVAPPGVNECVLTMVTDDVDGFVAKAEAAGATVVRPAAQKPWGYLALVADPDGHLWQLMRPPS